MRGPEPPDHRQIALKAAGGEQHMPGAQRIGFAGSEVLALHADDPSGLHLQRRDPEVPAEGDVRVAQHLPIDGRHQPEAATVRAMKTRHAVAELRQDARPANAHGLQPLPDLGARAARVVVHPVGVGVVAPFEEIPGRELRRILDAQLALQRRADDRHAAPGHHGVSAEHRPHVHHLDPHAALRGLQCRGESRDAGADDDHVGLCGRLGAGGRNEPDTARQHERDADRACGCVHVPPGGCA